MGTNHDKFIPWGQLNMLTVGQHDKIIRDLRNSKGSGQLSDRSIWIVVSGVPYKASNFVLSLSMLESLAKV